MRSPATSSFPALGTTATIAVVDPGALPVARGLLERELRAVDLACSRFRPDSELAQVQAKSGHDVAVSDLLLEAVDAALRGAWLTDGIVTPTIGRSLVGAGYDRDLAAIGPRAEPAVFMRAPDWRLVAVDRDRRTICIPPGTKLDLGATAKALAADRSATLVADRAGCGVLVSLGGDMRACGESPRGGWPVLVDDAHDAPTERAARIGLTGGGLATSSSTVRRWSRAGVELHHILDPRTGAPADGPWRTVSVAAATCLDANIASTAAVVLGEEAPAWLAERRLPARLVPGQGSVVTITGWPEERAA